MNSDPQAEQKLAVDPAVSGAARMRSESIQRLQIGLSGLVAMVLLVSLANIILDQARDAEQRAVGDDPAALAQGGTATPNPAKDPLADAGVAPEIAASPSPVASPPPDAGADGQPAQP